MRKLLTLIFCLLLLTPARASEIQYFQTPSRNIYCMAWDAPSPYIRCDVMQHSYAVPARSLEDCPYEEGDWGNSFLLEYANPGQMICASDSVANPDSPVLPYGQSFTYGQMTCTSKREGLTCENAEGGGFFISRKKQSLY